MKKEYQKAKTVLAFFLPASLFSIIDVLNNHERLELYLGLFIVTGIIILYAIYAKTYSKKENESDDNQNPQA